MTIKFDLDNAAVSQSTWLSYIPWQTVLKWSTESRLVIVYSYKSGVVWNRTFFGFDGEGENKLTGEKSLVRV